MPKLQDLYDDLEDLERQAETSLDDDLSDIERDIEDVKDQIKEIEDKL